MKVYVARDSEHIFNSSLFIYKDKPIKDKNNWVNNDDFLQISDDVLPEGVNPQWEDAEPIELEMQLLIPKK